jgi:predicted dehydrogenase
MWRIGMLAGTGTGRKRILPALRDSRLCRVTVVHGRDPERLSEIRRGDKAIRLVTDAAEFAELSDLFDMVYVGSPPFLRPRHIALAAKLGKPVLCEKPLATTPDQLADVLAAVTAADVPFAVAHHVRHQPAVADIKQIIDGGSLGAIRDAHLQWDFMMDLKGHNAAWKLQPSLAGSSSMYDSGVHALDLAVLLFGTPRAVCAIGQRRRTSEFMDSVAATLDYDTHTVTVTTSQAADSQANDLVVTGTEGVLRAPSLLSEKSLETLLIHRGQHHERRDYPATNLYRAMVEDFCRSIDGVPMVGTTIPHAVATSHILFAIEEAITTGRTVRMG